MTQQQLREFVFKLVKTCIEKKCYIKGYGDQFRIVDEMHSPVRNISKEVMKVLTHNKIYARYGLVYTLITNISPFTHYLEVQLPVKE